jgi:hypothetical protein
MLIDFFLLVSACLMITRLTLMFGLPVAAAAWLMFGAVLFVIAMHVRGSQIFRRHRIPLATAAFVMFSLSAADYQWEGALKFGIYFLAVPLSLFGLYVMIRAAFIDR